MTDSSKGVLLVVDDEPLKRATLQIELAGAGYSVSEAADAAAAMKVIETRPVDVVITDVRMPEMDGIQLLELVKSKSPRTHVILMTAYGTVDSAVEAIKRGAYDYITKPFPTEVLVQKLDRLLACRSIEGGDGHGGPETLGQLVGQSYASRRLFEQIRAVADSDRAVLIEGEAGSCRERVGTTLHQLSARSAGPMVKFNCTACLPELLEAELFGSAGEGGVRRTGRLDEAAGGTLFLDEVEALLMPLQARLLQAMDEGSFERVGGGRVRLEARLVFGTQENLRRRAEAGKFREDLYYRLDAVHLVIPPLRDRREDIPVLVAHYLRHSAKPGDGRPVPTRVSSHAMDVLMSYHWPGNVRELENVLERAVAFAGGPEIQPRDILIPSAGQPMQEVVAQANMHPGLTETIAGVEQSLIDAALRRAAGNQAKAAQFLGIPRTTLRDKMAKYGMVGKPAGREVSQQ
jgi:two-component system, NtrC family, response regulator HydG